MVLIVSVEPSCSIFPHVSFLKVPSSPLCVCLCQSVCKIFSRARFIILSKCCFALLSLVSPVLFTLMLAQETFSILPQDRLAKLLSSGLKVSLFSLSSPSGHRTVRERPDMSKHTVLLGFTVTFYSLLDCMSTILKYEAFIQLVVIKPVCVL